MITLDIRHPDSPDFAICKRDLTKITGANISLKVSKDFVYAVEGNKDYLLRWPVDINIDDIDLSKLEYDKLYKVSTKRYVKKIKAKELWDTIIDSNWQSAEPGILFWDNIIDYDLAGVYPEYKPISTNPCGEITLGALDSCRLIAVNLYSLVKYPFTEQAYINEDLAYTVFYEAQVIADTLVDVELKHIKRIIDLNDEPELWKKVYAVGKNGRRTGTGLTALGDMCAALGVPYGDPSVVERIMHIKLQAELDASIDLAITDGPFPAYNSALEFTSDSNGLKGSNRLYNFLLEEYPEQTKRMMEYGRRNISLSTVAPTGSLSILTGTTSGCEPVFSLYYQRRKKCNPGETPDFVDQNGVGFKTYMVIHPKFREWYKVKYGEELKDESVENLDRLYKESPYYLQTANDLTPEQRIDTQAILQKYTTHSISSTVNLPENIDKETVNKLYILGYEKNLKGLTTYRAGSRSGILINIESKDSTRPPELPCKVLRFKNEKKDWIAFIGIKDGKPYEIFTGINDLDEFPIPSYIEEGTIIKIPSEGKSRYDFRYVDNYGYSNTLGGLNRIFNKEYWNYARFVSALLREGVALENIIHIIEKLEFNNKSLNSWQYGVIRAIKSFIEDGTKTDEVCSECGEKAIVYENGCKICKNCGNSKCG
jgi:ribonucleoside-diphosphate reductase alpha chain